MKKTLALVGILAVMALAAAAAPVEFVSTSGAQLVFDGAGNFSFAPGGGGYALSVTSGTCTGCLGNINGVFTIGAPYGPLNMFAPVTGTGTLALFDGLDTLTASLDWVEMQSYGVSGTLNILGVVNTSNVQYAGTNPDLLSMLPGAVTTLTFQRTAPGLSPAYLATNQTSIGSFSGSISPVPEPGTYGLIALGLSGVALVRRRGARG